MTLYLAITRSEGTQTDDSHREIVQGPIKLQTMLPISAMYDPVFCMLHSLSTISKPMHVNENRIPLMFSIKEMMIYPDFILFFCLSWLPVFSEIRKGIPLARNVRTAVTDTAVGNMPVYIK